MALSATLRQTTCIFQDDGSVFASAAVELRDSAFGPLGTKHVELTDPQLLAGIKAAAMQLAPATEISLGVPLTLPVPAPAPAPAPPAGAPSTPTPPAS